MELKQIGIYIAIFIALNALLWGGQELYYINDTKEIKAIEAELNTEEISIVLLEKRIETQEAEIKKKENLLDYYDSINDVSSYNRNVDEFNASLNSYKQSLESYNNKLQTYNNKVERLNELIKSSGSRWYLIPIPLPGKSTRARL